MQATAVPVVVGCWRELLSDAPGWFVCFTFLQVYALQSDLTISFLSARFDASRLVFSRSYCTVIWLLSVCLLSRPVYNAVHCG